MEKGHVCLQVGTHLEDDVEQVLEEVVVDSDGMFMGWERERPDSPDMCFSKYTTASREGDYLLV